MNKEDAHIVIAMANHNMNVTDVARAIFTHRTRFSITWTR